MQWGDIVICTLAGDYGKPRPAVIVLSNLFNSTHACIVVCPITSYLINAPLFRIPITAHSNNGLNQNSQIMVDKITALRRDKITQCIEKLRANEQQELREAVKRWLQIS